MPRQNMHVRHTWVTNLSSTELKVDLHVIDEAGGCLVDVEGLTARQAGHRAHGLSNTLYEYQWKPSPWETVRAGRDPVSCRRPRH